MKVLPSPNRPVTIPIPAAISAAPVVGVAATCSRGADGGDRRSPPPTKKERAQPDFSGRPRQAAGELRGPAFRRFTRRPGWSCARHRRESFSEKTWNHTGSHKINNALGQALLARRMGKTRDAETGAASIGSPRATACALLGLDQSHLGYRTSPVRRQRGPMRLLGASRGSDGSKRSKTPSMRRSGITS